MLSEHRAATGLPIQGMSDDLDTKPCGLRNHLRKTIPVRVLQKPLDDWRDTSASLARLPWSSWDQPCWT
jgi:hypothetical protein